MFNLTHRYDLGFGIMSKNVSSSKQEKKLWGGRFAGRPSHIAEKISESISYDHKLAMHDIDASIAHAQMLEHSKILKPEMVKNIIHGLENVREEIIQNKMEFNFSLEDIHMHIESRLIELIGDDGKRLHTARSRNDQVATDTHLYLRSQISTTDTLLRTLLGQLLELARKHQSTLWAGYTHTQIAQPIRLAQWIMVWFWGFCRDRDALHLAYTETDICPLGAAAMAGPNYSVDRTFSAQKLGFSKIYENSMDAVSDRDYLLAFHFFASRMFVRISRLCEDLILYSSAEFGYVKMGDAVTTGSSIMPQKKNPDIAEILRGRSGRVNGSFFALLMNLKSLPLTYNRDLQEDKIYLFDTVEMVKEGLLGISEIFSNIEFFPEKVKSNLSKGFALATDLADFLVSEYEMPFRSAHEISGKIVHFAESKNLGLEELTKDDLSKLLPSGVTIPADLLSIEKSPERKRGLGSVNKQEIQVQLQKAKQKIEYFEKNLFS